MFYIKIAGIVVEIDNKYPLVEKICRDYFCERTEYDISASATDTEIGDEIIASSAVLGREVSSAYAESVCIYRKICLKLPEFDAFVFHASAVELDGRSYAFSARSGTGKSTHTCLWLEHFGKRARIINGDKPILRFFDGKLQVCGTPWCGKERLNSNDTSPLSAICFIERGKVNEIRRIDIGEAISRIASQIIIPSDELGIDVFFPLLEKMLTEIPTYVLRCNISDEAVTVAYNAMKN